MAEYNVQINKKVGNTKDTLYPVTKDKNVKVTSTNASLPANVSTAKDLVDGLGSMAFSSGSNLVYTEESTDSNAISESVLSEVNDDKVSTTTTWSSSKLKALFEQLGVTFE